VLAVVFPIWLVSVFTRAIARLFEPKFLTRNQLIQFEPMVGWQARPNLDTHHLMVDLFHIRTDKDGFRGDGTVENSDVVVFGDSFAAGYGVSEKHFFGNLRGPREVKAVGTGGYSMVQELLWMQRVQNHLRSKLVVWFVYYGNDLYDNLMPDLRGYRKPFVRETGSDSDWEVVSSHVTPAMWPIITRGRMLGENHPPKLAELCSDTFLASRAYSACRWLISQGKEICDEAGAPLVLLSVPDPMQLTTMGRKTLSGLAGNPQSFDADMPDRQLSAICRELDVQFVPGNSFLDISSYKTNDCHWNEKGHRQVFDMLMRLHAEQNSARSQRESAATLV
jgi:hypothetical protein